MSKISILFILNGLAHGGTEKQLIKLINGLNPNQYSLYLACFTGSDEFINPDKVHFYKFSYKPLYHPIFWFELLKLVRYVNKNRIQILQTYFQDPTIVGSILRLVVKSKLIISFRDLGFWETTIEKAKMNLFFRFGDIFVSNSHAVQAHYINNYHLPESKSVVIHNGLDINTTVHEMNASVKYIGIVANFNRRVKRVDDFLKMASLVHKEYSNAKFIIVGDGYLRSELVTLAKTLGILEQIEFVGRVSAPEEYINKFTIGLLTSESEGLSNTIMEYMATGIPVVATNVGGNPELIENDVNGFLVKTGNVDLLAEKVLYLLKNPTVAAKMGKLNREKMSKSFTTTTMIMNYEEMYNNLIQDV